MKIITNRSSTFRELDIYVDDDDFEYLNQFKWCVVKWGRTYYTHTYVKIGDRWTSIRMHRMLLGLTIGDNRIVDHIDGNGLNNQRSNIRIVDYSQNNRNTIISKNNTSGIVGVSFYDRANNWYARICDDSGKYICRSFSAKKYGYDQAKCMAIKQRKEWENELGYTIRYK